jgi:cytochrome c oxidase cbb3-type subunit I/II
MSEENKHRKLEGKALTMSIMVTVLVLIGGLVEFVPLAAVESNVPTLAEVKPLTPLELEGRDLYLREGCYNCHSQMIRPFRSETLRYGEYSRAGEFVYDHPFQWGSKRTGPDLARIGGKYPDAWHYRHMEDPQSTSQGSIMPPYKWLLTDALDDDLTAKKMKALRSVGVPYSDEEIANADTARDAQAQSIADGLAATAITVQADREIIALIAYLQRLGTDFKGGGDGNVEAAP